MPIVVLLRGGGDLASGVALRLFRTGFHVLITELPQPLAVRRTVSFANAVYEEEIEIEGVQARLAPDAATARELFVLGIIPVLVDPSLDVRNELKPDVIVDARMMKMAPDLPHPAAPLSIGMGPGFEAGLNCHAVIETKRGHYLGRVYWEGTAEPDTGKPEPVNNHEAERVLRAPADGVLHNRVRIGDAVQQGDIIAEVNGQVVEAHFDGTLRGLLFDGVRVQKGLKIGDLDPRPDNRMHHHISDKALAVGGGVLEAILTWPEMRARLACK